LSEAQKDNATMRGGGGDADGEGIRLRPRDVLRKNYEIRRSGGTSDGKEANGRAELRRHRCVKFFLRQRKAVLHIVHWGLGRGRCN